MNESINIREYLDIFKRRKLILIGAILVSLVVGGILTIKNYKSYTPMYQSKVKLRTNFAKHNPEETISLTTSTNQSLATGYSHLAESVNSLNGIKSKLGLDVSTDYLASNIEIIHQESNTEFFDIIVKYPDKEMAQKIAKTIPDTFSKEFKRVVKLDAVEVVEDATPATGPINSPNYKALPMALIVGIVVGLFFVFLLEALNNKLTTPEEAEQYWGVTLLGTIPYDDGKAIKGKKMKVNAEVN